MIRELKNRWVYDAAQPSLSAAQVHSWSCLLGVVTGLLGTVYSKVLQLALRWLWQDVPRHYVPQAWGWLYPLGICTAGGLIVHLAGIFGKPGGMDDWVKSVHNACLPSNSFVGMLVASFVTAACGFSVGPEAPMVICGGIIGSSVAADLSPSTRRVVALAASSGALSAFFQNPFVGALFVLELPHEQWLEYHEALSPTMLASVVGAVIARLANGDGFRGRYEYGELRRDYPMRLLLAPVLVGVVCAAWSIVVSWGVRFLKNRWKKKGVCVKLLAGLTVGTMAIAYPQTLFWGEASLQSMLDAQSTPLWLVKDGPLLRRAFVDPTRTLSPFGAVQVALAKTFTIGIASAAGFPGGVIFPFMFAAAAASKASRSVVSPSMETTLTLSAMAALQTAVTRTPLATLALCTLTAASFATSSTNGAADQAIAAILPFLLVAVITAMLCVSGVDDSTFIAAQTSRPDAPDEKRADACARDLPVSRRAGTRAVDDNPLVVIEPSSSTREPKSYRLGASSQNAAQSPGLSWLKDVIV